jgi:acetyltransferase-like isoleucine patch superfamily enzyme
MRLKQLRHLRTVLVSLKRLMYVRIFKMDIHPSVQFSLSVNLDKTNPRGIHIAEDTYLSFDVAVLTHDLTRGVRRHTRIGKRCFIGCRAVIMPGITVGNGSIVGAGSVVVEDVPPDSIVAGNPAKLIRQGINAGPYGRLPGADDTQRREAALHQLD